MMKYMTMLVTHPLQILVSPVNNINLFNYPFKLLGHSLHYLTQLKAPSRVFWDDLCENV